MGKLKKLDLYIEKAYSRCTTFFRPKNSGESDQGEQLCMHDDEIIALCRAFNCAELLKENNEPEEEP